MSRPPGALTVALCALVSASLGVAAPPAAPDPWAKVPKASTACYSSQDAFIQENEAAIEAMKQEVQKQQEVNEGLKAKLNAIEPMERASKMQSYMMQNPQEAMRLMQLQQKQGNAVLADVTKDNDAQLKLDNELKEIEARYKAALAKATEPIQAKMKTLYVGGEGARPEDIETARGLVKQINAEYEKACPQWWGASGAFQDWLSRYKQHLIQDRIPPLDASENDRAAEYKIYGIPADGFRSTIPMETVIQYMERSQRVLDGRWHEPRVLF